jgi:BMFP domain-containing protein YqiC
MSIAAPVNRSAQIRKLHADGLTAEDIVTLTGFRLANVRAALRRKPKDKLKSRVAGIEARGPLSSAQVAERTGMPLSGARLMVR